MITELNGWLLRTSGKPSLAKRNLIPGENGIYYCDMHLVLSSSREPQVIRAEVPAGIDVWDFSSMARKYKLAGLFFLSEQKNELLPAYAGMIGEHVAENLKTIDLLKMPYLPTSYSYFLISDADPVCMEIHQINSLSRPHPFERFRRK